jgi:YcxB-like protein
MEITYYVTEKDLIMTRRFARKTSPLIKRIYNVTMLIVVLIPCIGFLLRGQFTVFSIVLMLMEVLTMILFVFGGLKIAYPLMDRYSIKLLKKKNNGVLGEHKIYLTEEAMIESTSVNQSHNKWNAIERIDENDNYIFITTTAWNIYNIPKRDFSSSDAATQFYSQARTYHEKSRLISI